MKLTIIGMRYSKYMGQYTHISSNHTGDIYDNEIPIVKKKLPKYAIYLKNDDNKYYKLTLYTKYGVCPSGYTTASWGVYKFKKVKNLGTMNYIPKKASQIDYEKKSIYKSKYFEYDHEGVDGPWYPKGYVKVNMKYFSKTQNN